MNERMKQHQAQPQSPPSHAVYAAQICADAVSPPFDYFELISIKSVQQQGDDQKPSASSPPAAAPSSDNSPPTGGSLTLPASDAAYEIVFRKLIRKNSAREGEGGLITPEMFRVAVSMRWLDNLEYIVTAGEYKQSFPYYGSVAGMSLLARRTIVMDRDKYKKFRTNEFVDGKTPSQADQPRGRYEIDYLSYICVPMASSFGKPVEQSLGVLHADTKLFACPEGKLPSGTCQQTVNDAEQGIYRIIIKTEPANLTERLDDKLQTSLKEIVTYACNLYVQDDSIVKYLEDMRGVIVPLLELYKKCRTGAINETKPSQSP
jgi:hypothetical protein